jgi:hypothetical protein
MKNCQTRIIFTLVLLQFCAAGCIRRDPDFPEVNVTPIVPGWPTEQRCTPIFSPPKLVNKMCVSDVTTNAPCEKNPQPAVTFVAFPIGAGCDSLRAQRDFFPKSAYGGDPDFLPILKHVAAIVRREAAKGSVEFLKLGKTVSTELSIRQMASLSSMRLSSVVGFEYEFSFVLPESRSAVLLTVSANGRIFRWARMVDN